MAANQDRAPETVEDRVRRRLRQIRTERGLTLQQVADRANIDVSTLSRLESGKRRFALDHLPRLAAGLGVRTDQLIEAEPVQDPRVRGKAVRRDGLIMWPLSDHGSSSGLNAFRMEIRANRNRPPEQLRTHEGYEWLYVLHGRLRLLLGDQDYVLNPGEAAEFSTWTPHWFGALDGAVEAIVFFGPQGQRAHLRG